MPNTLEQLKQARSSIKTERQPVSQVQDALRETKEITQFVKAALGKENRWILQAGEQESIVAMLSDINRINKELYNKCRTPHHFEQQASHFLAMKNRISHLARCIHLSLDQGFYDTEPKGFSPGKAVEISWQQIRNIREGVRQGKWERIPIATFVADSAKDKVEKLCTEVTPVAEQLLKNQNLKSFDSPMSIQEVQTVYQYFQKAHHILDLEEQGLELALAKASEVTPSSPEEILSGLTNFEGKLKKLSRPRSHDFPQWGLQLYELSQTDVELRMHLLRIPFEPLGFLRRHLRKLEDQKKQLGREQSISNFHEYATQELEHLQLFIDTFQGMDGTLREVSGILQNLSISFGKVYHSASSNTLSGIFLGKTLGLVRGLLEKGGRVAGSKSQKLQNLQQGILDTDLFDAPIIEGMLHALQLLEQGKLEMRQYSRQLTNSLETLSAASDWDSGKVYAFLQESYNQRTMLTSASMVFGSVAQICIILMDSLKQIQSLWEELGKLREQGLEAPDLYEQTVSFLGRAPEFDEQHLQRSTEQLDELNWTLDEMLVRMPQEELRFVQELRAELEPVRIRILAQKKKTAAPAAIPKPESGPYAAKTETQPVLGKPKLKTTKKDVPAFTQGLGRKKENYDPFPPEKMETLKKALKNMESEQAKMISYALAHNHTFFTLLNKLERVYKMDQSSEYQLEQKLENSRSTHEFLSNFARLKFLTKGYYNSNDAPFDYDEKGLKFDIRYGVEKFLKLNKSTINTPMEVYRRLIRVLLGLDDVKTVSTIMPRQALSILQEDLKLPHEEQKLAEDSMRLG